MEKLKKQVKAAIRDGYAGQLALIGLSVLATVVCAVLLVRSRQHIYTVRLATGGLTGEYYAFGKAIAQVSQKHTPNIQIEVLETPGSKQNMDSLQSHTVDMALVQSNTPVQPNVRAVAQLYPELFHLIARKTANLQSMADLKDKRIALMPIGSGSYELFWPLANHYGLQASDFSAEPMAADEAHEALRQGNVDALFRIIGLGNPAVAELLKTAQFQLIPIQQVGALQLTQPYLEPTLIPQGSYDGSLPVPPQDLPVISVSALLVAHKDVHPEVVKAITAILYEHRNELITLNPRAASIQAPEASQNLGFPLHPGAKAYYTQDEPPFFVRYAETMGLLLSLSILGISGIWQFRLWLIGRQKNRADDYNLEILALLEQVENAVTLQELQTLRKELFSILRQVVIDLDVDKISPESFQSFTFPWEVAMTTLHHQETVLYKANSDSAPSTTDSK
ncbi:MAG: TAXI family TRAP transporter solute-binding subunit [Phormidesmis sp. RL_2_1]|nr:TAXI family TRAP transporter solute-binding subunit [Phormidesmis sp. RL_2_1]